jgi:hypothetical protein
LQTRIADTSPSNIQFFDFGHRDYEEKTGGSGMLFIDNGEDLNIDGKLFPQHNCQALPMARTVTFCCEDDQW